MASNKLKIYFNQIKNFDKKWVINMQIKKKNLMIKT